jgi:hypothetical protein
LRFQTKWTEDLARDICSQYSSLNKFYKENPSLYVTLQANGWHEELTSHMTRKIKRGYTYDEIQQEALRYNSKKQFKKGSSKHHSAAIRLGILDQVCSHMTGGRFLWDPDKVKEKALEFDSRDQFSRNASGAYLYCLKNNILDEVCQHMGNGLRCDNDVVYIWKVEDIHNLYKVGVTSKRLGLERIQYVSAKSGLTPSWVKLFYTPSAVDVEKQVLCFGRPFRFEDKFSGYTEFVNLTSEELNLCLSIMEAENAKHS